MARHRLLFQKDGRAIYLSHLDLMRTMQRAFVRAKVKIRHTEGFNPHPYISVALPLSVGVESKVELLDFELVDDTPLETLPERLTAELPEGITVREAYEAERKAKEIAFLRLAGTLDYDAWEDTAEIARKLGALFGQAEIPVKKRTKKKEETEINLRPLIRELRFTSTAPKKLTLEALVAAQNPPLSPNLLIAAIEQNEKSLSPDFAAFMRLELYDKDGKVFR